MKNGRIGVGIVGLSARGGWAATAHIPALRSLAERFEIVGLSASTPSSAKVAAEKHEVPFYTDSPAELASRADVDLVVVTVKVPRHHELVSAAIFAGKSVYCEWPLGNGLIEAEDLAEKANKHGIKSFVGLQARSGPPVCFLRDLIRDGYIGEVLSTSVIASGGPPWGGSATSSSVYATDQSNGASMLTIPFAHSLDALELVLGNLEQPKVTLATRRPIVTVSDTSGTAHATAADQIALNGVLTNGAVVSMHYRGGTSRGTNFLWEINGTHGDIVITGGIGHLQFGLVQLQSAVGDEKTLRDLQIPDSYRQVPGDPRSLSYTVAHAYRNVAQDLAENSSHAPNFETAVRLHRTIESIETGAKP